MKHALYFILFLIPLLGTAQWSSNPAVNNAINTMAGEQAMPKIATCPNGDSYIAFFSFENGNYNVRMQRLDFQGYEIWTAGGILISNHPQMSWLTDWDMAADPSNHAILTFQDIRNGGNNNVVAYRIAPDGTFVWGPDGIALSNSSAFNVSPKVVVTAAGNAVIAWQADDVIIRQKIDPAGSLLWGTSGITMSGPNTYSWPQLLPVGLDEVIMKYFEDSGPPNAPIRHVYAQKFDASGAAVWSTPAVVSTAGGISAWTQVLPFINDGSDGFYIGWHDDRDNNMRASVWVQHINSSGTAIFPPGGSEASTQSSNNHFYAHLALPPDSSEVMVFWNEMNGNQSQWGIYGQKFTSTGTRLWPNSGQVFIEVGPTNVYPFGARSSPTDAVVFYLEYYDVINAQVQAMRINSSGTLTWTPFNRTLSSVSSEKVHPEVNEFNSNQWICSWEDTRNGGNRDIYAQNIQLEGILGPWDPQIGTITGTVSLIGGTASVTEVDVSASGVTVHPDAAGFYTMDVPAGIWNVTASLLGYYPDTVFSVAVIDEEITPGVDMSLEAMPAGFIDGTVLLDGGQGNVADVVITIWYHIASPDANGDYDMEVEAGTYDVTASLEGYVTGIIPAVVVAEDDTTFNVDFTLVPVPTTGLITGIVELENDAGDVAQVLVSAGGVTISPDSTGFYSLEVLAGIWDVSASLEGFYTQVVQGVVVVAGETTPDIDFLLLQIPDVGFVSGYVTLVNGTGDVTLSEVTAGGEVTHPAENGHYYLGLPPGTYTVFATHPYAIPDSTEDISIIAGETFEGVDFELVIARTDMACKAFDNYGEVLYNVDVEITGPEATYSGTITGDSLLFMNVPYGLYEGTGYYDDIGMVVSSAELGPDNHEIIFMFTWVGQDEQEQSGSTFSVFPNPLGEQLGILYTLPAGERMKFSLHNVTGAEIWASDEGISTPGPHTMTVDVKGIPRGVYLLKLCAGDILLTKVLLKP